MNVCSDFHGKGYRFHGDIISSAGIRPFKIYLSVWQEQFQNLPNGKDDAPDEKANSIRKFYAYL